MSTGTRRDLALREFRVSRQARDRYRFDETLFSVHGNVVLANFHAARVFAQRMNEGRDLVGSPEESVSAARLNALGLIDELMHLVVARYREQVNPRLMDDALAHLEGRLGRGAVGNVLRRFVDEFPPAAVYRQELTAESYLEGRSGDTGHREVALEELLLLWLANSNPAFAPFRELFDDHSLRRHSAYAELVGELESFCTTQPTLGSRRQSLIDLLRAPALASPSSLDGQLEFIRASWAELLGPEVYRLLASLDFLAEEQKAFFGFGPGPVEPPDFAGQEEEAEAFSPDLDWMPRLVLLAKNAHVWLAQLSKRYQRDIRRLDEVPDEELDLFAAWGMTGLWLIGVWQRSRASERIKRMMGDADAVASAYSVDDYRVADDLGGETAFADLRRRAWQRGIRMATDMVPNHVGIDSRWVIEHPDWFIASDHSPFPSYSFSGPDLCDDERVGIFLEDHYSSRSDAAVVFQRVDHWSGDARYVYHGNDGTSMPWNDTAQLDYRRPEVREAVIATILHVARLSPIIRFDAAMTLTKRHYHRLWFPEPGSGGDIPSRADHGMTRQAFDAVMPTEFWREVVDRVAAEAPDTLLLAEAFWLLEGYFVRTLGMHRVYNSAFMNMLRDERNAEYRQLIKSTLEFDPQILKRYVNFMSNPDERTAIDQFGRGDKYFGVATMMATLPGLPMFGHGQIEGFAEKYGMEFYRPRWHEEPDPGLVERHQRRVFPLLHRRPLFAEVERFLLFDFFTADGGVDENVFAYCNALGEERVLVLYHNRFAETRGWIRTSTAVAVRGQGEDKVLVQRSFAEGLGISRDDSRFLVYRDVVSGLEFIRHCRTLCDEGLSIELHAYEHRVLADFREVVDDASRRFARLHEYLGGSGVPSIDDALAELVFAAVLGPFRRLVGADLIRRLVAGRVVETDGEAGELDGDLLDEVEETLRELLDAVRDQAGGSGEDVDAVAAEVRAQLAAVLALPALAARAAASVSPGLAAVVERALAELEDDPGEWAVLLLWVFCRDLGRMVEDEGSTERSRSWIDEWRLGTVAGRALRDLGLDEGAALRAIALAKLLLSHERWFDTAGQPDDHLYRLVRRVVQDPEGRAVLAINRQQGVVWFNQECFEELLRWLVRVAIAQLAAIADTAIEDELEEVLGLVEALDAAQEASDFRVDRLLEALMEPAPGIEDNGASGSAGSA